MLIALARVTIIFERGSQCTAGTMYVYYCAHASWRYSTVFHNEATAHRTCLDCVIGIHAKHGSFRPTLAGEPQGSKSAWRRECEPPLTGMMQDVSRALSIKLILPISSWTVMLYYCEHSVRCDTLQATCYAADFSAEAASLATYVINLDLILDKIHDSVHQRTLSMTDEVMSLFQCCRHVELLRGYESYKHQ